MWTYLVLFLSVLTLVLIFFRRVIFVILKKDIEALKAKKNSIKKKSKPEPEKKGRLTNKEKDEIERLFKRGVVMMEAGKDEEAIKCFVQALAIDPKHKDSMDKLGVLYMHKQMYAAAAALFKELIDMEENSVHLSHLGLALYNQNEFEEAKSAYQRAVEIDPERPQRFVSLAQVYRATEEPSHAVIALNKAIELDPENIEYLFFLVDLFFEIDEFEKAKDTVRMILEKDPSNEEAKKLLRKRRS